MEESVVGAAYEEKLLKLFLPPFLGKEDSQQNFI